jgi:hypothetical protein
MDSLFSSEAKRLLLLCPLYNSSCIFHANPHASILPNLAFWSIYIVFARFKPVLLRSGLYLKSDAHCPIKPLDTY